MAKSAWVTHVTAYYRARKAKDKSYKFSSAMKDSRASYTKKGAAPQKKKPA